MNHKFITIAESAMRSMHQLIDLNYFEVNLNTTIVLTNGSGEIVFDLHNISAKQEYLLNCKEGDKLEWKGIREALDGDEAVEGSEEDGRCKQGQKLYSIFVPVHNAYLEIIGCVGVFVPNTLKRPEFIRGILKLTVEAIEGQWKSLELKADYDRVYNQLLGTLETIPIGTIVTDHEMTIIHVNDTMQKIFDKESVHIIGKKVDDFLNSDKFFQKMMDENKAVMDEEMSFCMAGGEIKCEVIVSLVKGEESEKNQGLVIKLKNINYMKKFKPSKEDKGAQFYFEDISGKSKAMQEVIRLGKIAARSSSNVFILGESGTGKELFAQAIHNHSSRREWPFVAINCGAMPKGLIESELFGYEGGAFTGAKKEGRPGKFEQADGGTLFLDEIGDMPLDEQVRLLRVLQNKEIVRVGGTRTIKINVRIIAATNRDVEKEVLENHFRKDLFYRLNVFTINIPSLQQRPEDIADLAKTFIKRYNILVNKEIKGVDEKAMSALLLHKWAGNIRELENVVERGVNIARGDQIGLEDLPASFKQLAKKYDIQMEVATSGWNIIQQQEIKTIEESLQICIGNVSRAAQQLGIGRRSLYRKLSLYNIDPLVYRMACNDTNKIFS